MANVNSSNKKIEPKGNRAHEFLKEWKQRRKDDAEKFQQELNSPEYRKRMESLRGKIVKNENIVQSS